MRYTAPSPGPCSLNAHKANPPVRRHSVQNQMNQAVPTLWYTLCITRRGVPDRKGPTNNPGHDGPRPSRKATNWRFGF